MALRLTTRRNSSAGEQPARPLARPRMRSYDGIYRSAFRYPPYSLDLLTQQQGYDTADLMLTMSACRSPFNVKRYALQADGWEVVAAVTDPIDARHEEAQVYADFATWVFSNMQSPAGLPVDMMTVVYEISRGMWEGFRVSELLPCPITYGPWAGRWGLRGLSAKHAKQTGFDYDPETQEILYVTSYVPGGSVVAGDPRQGGRLMQSTMGGYDFTVPVDQCLIYSYNPDAGITNSPGDWRASFKDWFVLDNTQRFWAMALERWGGPVIIGTADTNNQDQMQAAQQTMDNIRQGGAAIMPKNVPWELASVAGTVFDGFLNCCKFHKGEIAMNILGNLLSTNEGEHGSTSAGSDVHQDVGQTVFSFSRKSIESAITRQVIDRLLGWNFAGYNRDLCPRFSLGGDQTSDIYSIMQSVDLGIKDGIVWKGERWIRENVGWPPMTPEDQAAMEKEQQQQQQQEIEAQQQIADARNSGRVAAMSDAGVKRAMELLMTAIEARQYVEEGKS